MWQMKMGLAASNHSNIIPAQSVGDLQPTYGGGGVVSGNVGYDMHNVVGGHYGHNGGGLPMGDDGGSYSYNHHPVAGHLMGDDYNNYNNTLRSSHSARQDQYCADPYGGMQSNVVIGGQGGHSGHMDQQLGEFCLYNLKLIICY